MCWWERARDLTTILDWASDDGPLARRLDLANVFAGGFSARRLYRSRTRRRDLGSRIVPGVARQPRARAAAARVSFPIWPTTFRDCSRRASRSANRWHVMATSYRDARVRAVATFAPAPPVRAFTPESLRAITVPVSIVVGKGDREAPYDDCTLWLLQHNPAFDVALLGPDVGHYVFLPAATDTGKTLEPDICRDPDGVDRRAIHRDAAVAAEALFRSVIDRS